MLTLRWSAQGSNGPPVVLLPGLQGSGSTLLALARRLAPRWTVRVYDLPDGTLSAATAALRTALHDRPHVVAAGISGLWACRLARSQRASLACIGAPLGPRPPISTGAGIALRLGSPLGRIYQGTLRERLVRDGVPSRLASAAAASSRGALARLSWLEAEPMPCPMGRVLWMHGADDPARPPGPTAVRAWIPHALLATMPGRHRPFASHPSAVAEALETFWTDPSPPEPAST